MSDRFTPMLLEKLWPYVSRMVIDGADHDAVAVLGVIDMMRLKPKPAEARPEFAGKLADAGKVGEQAEGAFKAGVIGVSLIAAESCGAVVLDFVKLRASTRRNPKATHAGARRVGLAPRPKFPPSSFRSQCRNRDAKAPRDSG